MQYENIRLEISDGLAWLIFNRPDQLNAMNTQMMKEIIDALQKIDASNDVRSAIMTGSGKAFMAGADIKEYATQTKEEFTAFQTLGRNVYASIEGNSKPVIVAINGYAFGGGFEIALACDMIVAASGAKMGLPEIHLNLIPGGGGVYRLAKKIGINLANEMVMLGKTMLAEELKETGVINHIFPHENFSEETTKFAGSFVDKDPECLLAIKQLSHLSTGTPPVIVQSIENNYLKFFYHKEGAQNKIREFYQKSMDKKK